MLVDSNGHCQDRLSSCLLQLQKMPLWQLPLQSGEAACCSCQACHSFVTAFFNRRLVQSQQSRHHTWQRTQSRRMFFPCFAQSSCIMVVYLGLMWDKEQVCGNLRVAASVMSCKAPLCGSCIEAQHKANKGPQSPTLPKRWRQPGLECSSWASTRSKGNCPWPSRGKLLSSMGHV